MKNTIRNVVVSAASIALLLYNTILYTLQIPFLLLKYAMYGLLCVMGCMDRAVKRVVRAWSWLVTARVRSPRFVINAPKSDAVCPSPNSQGFKKDHYDVQPWEVPQGNDTIKVMGGYTHPPLGHLAPGKIQSYWAHLIDCEKAHATKKSDGKALLAATEVIKAELMEYFNACREAVTLEMQKARGFVNWLVEKVNEREISRKIAKVNTTVPSEPDISALLGKIVNEPIISLDELSRYNDRIETERKNYVAKMQAFQARAKERYRVVYNAFHMLTSKDTVRKNEWALIQGEAKLEGSQLTPASCQKRTKVATPGSQKNQQIDTKERSISRRLFVDTSTGGEDNETLNMGRQTSPKM